MVQKALIFILTSVIIYFGIASVLMLLPKPEIPGNVDLDFSELFIDYSGLPELKSYEASDGSWLNYRYYESQSDKIIVLIHGSGWHSQYFYPLADYISTTGLAHVYTPDLRGHGLTPKRRGDVDYFRQLEDDLADFISLIREDNPTATLVVGGHSSGGGLAIRFGGGKYGNQADAYLLLSPYLKYNAPTMRKNSGGWAYPYTARIAGLTMLNNVGIHLFDHLPVIEFNMPEEARDGTETLFYTHRLLMAYAPQDYKKDLEAMKQALMVVVGTADEAFIADLFEAEITQYTDAQVKLLTNVKHMGLVIGPEIRDVLKEWIESL